MPNRSGALPHQTIVELCELGRISGAAPTSIQAASLDPTLSNECFQVEGDFFPTERQTVREALAELHATPHDLSQPLARGATYAIRCNETLTLPKSVYALGNAKSSSGRNNLLARFIVDRMPRYDLLPRGYTGELWLLAQPGSFNTKLSPGIALTQLRFFNRDTRFDELELDMRLERDGLLWSKAGQRLGMDDARVSDEDGSIILTLDLSGTVAGYEALDTGRVLDFSKLGAYQPEDFFRPLYRRDGRISLMANGFYILLTQECVRVPAHLACEMDAVDVRSGQFITHRAGFIDPGWGWGTQGEGLGKQLVCEVVPFRDLVMREGQALAKVRFERLTEPTDQPYNGNYTRQRTPRLSKHFVAPAEERTTQPTPATVAAKA
ncbi:MAG: 2'-deoxycytidine 5'-triphosphate deaminase [Candidatus Andersenbacteria bacterium]